MELLSESQSASSCNFYSILAVLTRRPRRLSAYSSWRNLHLHRICLREASVILGEALAQPVGLVPLKADPVLVMIKRVSMTNRGQKDVSDANPI
ncbi:hypothetical protein Hypma_012175 [Hypsizygus marmoreus]|uniref:Uncharacterized protein n=1 Tax=Hypsizygus marmoreus TaxID=39966 RepID=A0A369JF42_HYPMA|nr:hypothetical protein Hypma_012175 [Hypsizygus marmoreus]